MRWKEHFLVPDHTIKVWVVSEKIFPRCGLFPNIPTEPIKFRQKTTFVEVFHTPPQSQTIIMIAVRISNLVKNGNIFQNSSCFSFCAVTDCDLCLVDLDQVSCCRISTVQASPVSTTSASRSQVQQLKDTISIGIVNGE